MADGRKFHSFESIIRTNPKTFGNLKINDALNLYEIVRNDIEETDKEATYAYNIEQTNKMNRYLDGENARQYFPRDPEKHKQLLKWHDEMVHEKFHPTPLGAADAMLEEQNKRGK